MATILTDRGELTAATDDGLWLDAADAERATGWVLKPEGMCCDDLCVPLPAAMVAAGRVDVAGFWRRLGNPVVHDEARQVWALGAGAAARRDALAGDAAPDFALPDFAGVTRRLSELRGRKVFLSTWASW
ncbi:MAG: hypothetical protein JNL66_15515 [Alphaproteobacteria bacterium]|nr:hypothetical protein [Alphaproteobacteria bacterium]